MEVCPNCLSESMKPFFTVERTPVNSMLLLYSKEEAIHFPTGRVRLGFCQSCGFISNLDFDPHIVEYSPRYEATQNYSPSFSAYLNTLVEDLVSRYNLRDRQIVEIGCGQGEFLSKICEVGGNQGRGFDPAFNGDMNQANGDSQVQFVRDYFSEKYAPLECDLVVCRMTLEHIPETHNFVRMLRNSLAPTSNPLIFFQVPNASRILRELAFWDIYYEHCSYFVPDALAWLFRACGFEIILLAEDYASQYLNIIAKTGESHPPQPIQKGELAVLETEADNFRANCENLVRRWQERLKEWGDNKRLIIWGASSKGVSFLNMLAIRDQIHFVVDINPKKVGTFLPGTGQEVISPDRLQEYQPEIVIVMNPVYVPEIRDILARLDLYPQLVTL